MPDVLGVFLFAREPVPLALFVLLVAIIAAVLGANVLEWYRRVATRRARGRSVRQRAPSTSLAHPAPDEGRVGSSVGLVEISPTKTTVVFGESVRAHPRSVDVNAGRECA